jgi:hypothetical protein
MRPDTQTLLLAAGAAACLLAILWRALAHHRQASRLVGHLAGAVEPEERARAGQSFIDLGLRRAATPVLHAMEREPDDRVRLSIALAVARRQWEPTGPSRVAALRRWASEELDFQGHPVKTLGPAITRLADMGGPRLPESPRAPTSNGNGDGSTTAEPIAVASPPAAGYAADAPTIVMAPPDVEEPTSPDVYGTGSGIHWVAPGSIRPPGP